MFGARRILRNLADFSEVVRWGLRAGVSDAALRQHLLAELDRPHALPSPTTLRRHRLTLHMGFCMWEQTRTNELLERGCVAHGMVGSSPQGQHDWVLRGSRRLPLDELVGLMAAANRLCAPGVSATEERVLMHKLEAFVSMSQGVPTAVGSGQQSLRRKVQAAAHSLRLTCPSWAATAQLIGSFCTFTGDLGVESGFWLFRQSLTKLFGPWVVHGDRGSPATGAGSEGGDVGEFDSRPSQSSSSWVRLSVWDFA